MHLRELSERISHSLWFIPTVSVILAAAAALGMVGLSDALGQDGSELPIIFNAGPDGARAMLQAIAGSVITVAGVTFSITIVALQLTSTQFSPRALRNFLSDRSNQVVLGVFMATFTYALLVLRSIHSEDEQRGAAFVPGPAITVGLILAFASLGMLIYFIHHISVRIQVTSIVASVANETLRTVAELSRWNQPNAEPGWQATDPAIAATAPPRGTVAMASTNDVLVIRARKSGYLQLIDLERLVRVASELDGRYRLLVAPGSWVQAEAPIATFEGRNGMPVDRDRPTQTMRDSMVVSDERSQQQDATFGIQQLVDIAVKALSPSVNDPTTAMNCIDRLVQCLTAAGAAADPPRGFADDRGELRLEVPFPGFDELVPLSFDQIRHYGGATPALVIHLARSLTLLHAALPDDRHAILDTQARLLNESAERIEHEWDRRRALAALAALRR